MGIDQRMGWASATGATSGETGHAAPGKETLPQQLAPGPARPPTKRRLISAPPAVRSPGLDGDRGYKDAENALFAMAEIFEGRGAADVDASCGPYVLPLRQIAQALAGKAAGRPLSAAARKRLFLSGARAMQPAIDALTATPEGANWVAYAVRPYWFDVASYDFSAAKERAQHAIVVGDHAVDVPPEDAPHEQARALHDAIHKLVPTMREIDEQLIHYNEHAIDHEIDALLAHGKAHGARGRLAEVADVLLLVDGWLELTDDELPRRLEEIRNVFDGVETYSELVKAIVELTGGAVGVTAKAIALVATASGKTGIAASAAAVARGAGKTFGDIVAGVEVVVGMAEIFDPDSTPGERLDGAIHAATGSGWLVGAQTVGADTAFSATMPVLLGYEEWKWAVTTYWESAVGIDSFLIGPAFEKLAGFGAHIARSSEMLVKSMLVEQGETNAAARATLRQVTARATFEVAEDIALLLDACVAPDVEGGGQAGAPGGWSIFRELIAPLRAYRHAGSAALALEGATVALRKLAWANRYPGLIVEGSVRNESLATVEETSRKIELMENLEHGE